MNLVRTFVAIRIPIESILGEVWAELREKFDYPQVKWVDTQALHLTLFFLGDTPEGDIEIIGNDLKSILKVHERFKLNLTGLGYFGNPSNPRVIWVGLERSVQLSIIKRDVSQVLASYGFLDDQRAFNPHITLGRVKNIKNTQSFLMHLHGFHDFKFQQTEVMEIIHFKSELKPTGPVYTPINQIGLM